MTTTFYDSVPYIGYPFAQTHPDRLATIASLHGLQAAPVNRCRVLELGCGDGGNLVPMALQFPESQFVGVDLSAEAIARGHAAINKFSLRNLNLQQGDLLEVGDDLGEFDYILAHGVYTWVPPAVKDRLLALSHDHLAAHGIVYVSYNTYPGYHIRQMTREMMLFHTRDMQQPNEKIQQGVSLLKFLLQKYPTPEEARTDLYGALLTEQLDLLLSHRHKEQIFHDDLADINTPVYFYQFVRHASQFGLQFLSEADFHETQHHTFQPKVREMLDQFGDENVLLREQYLDFLKCRMFRQTLLCKQDVAINRQLNANQLEGYLISSSAHPVNAELDLRPGMIEEFAFDKHARLSTDFPFAKAALLELRQAFPRRLTLEEIAHAARVRLELDARQQHYDLGALGDDEVQVLKEIMFAAYRSGLLKLHTYQPALTTEVSTRPEVFPLARWQAQQEPVVTNLIHQSIEIDDALGLHLLQLLDGSRRGAGRVNGFCSRARTANGGRASGDG
jgi:methyltransferase-like protein/protein-L-isoaspartate O-methyltransferase